MSIALIVWNTSCKEKGSSVPMTFASQYTITSMINNIYRFIYLSLQEDVKEFTQWDPRGDLYNVQGIVNKI